MVRTPLHKEKSSAKYGSAMKALLFSQITDQEVGQRTRASQESHHTIIVCSRNVAAVSLPASRSGFSAEADASGCMRVCQIYFSVACGEKLYKSVQNLSNLFLFLICLIWNDL